MDRRLAVLGIGACAFYGVFEAALALAAPWGRAAFGGRHEVLPGGWRLLAAAVAVFYVALGGFIAWAARGGETPRWLPRTYLALGLFFVLGVPINLASRSAPERFQAIGAAALAIVFIGSWRLARRAGPSG